ncbi:sensor domain-containing protein [Nocardia sp. NPDC059764]|uniref:sensor domain-containing protein n=1 Tax=Nocardia sp. NPDC059764 TaxID=3346939 RepID=UPI0036574189
MTQPSAPPVRSTRRTARTVGIVTLGTVLAACGTTVTGHPTAVRNPAPVATADQTLTAMLPDPSKFPARYTAVVLSPETAAQAAYDLEGYLPGAQVDPSTCAPVAPKTGPAVSVGTDDHGQATLTVVLTRPGKPLSTLRDQLRQCGTVKVGHTGVTSVVTTQLDPPPPVIADDSLALRRTVGPENRPGGPENRDGLTRSMQTLIGQVGEVRVAVTYMTSGSTSDTEALDTLFTAAVRKVRKG